MDPTEPIKDNTDQLDDNFDAFNDETFGEMDSTDWECEHDKLTSITSDPNDNHINDSLHKIDFKKNTSFNENRIEDDSNYGFEDLIVKSLSNLGLEDEELEELNDFEDPAIVTYARSSKSMNSNPIMADQVRRLSHSSPPPPAFHSYDESSASPKGSSIWSTTQMDTQMDTPLTHFGQQHSTTNKQVMATNMQIPPWADSRQIQPMRFSQNRYNNLYNRQPVLQLIPGMVPGIGRTMFPPALIPNSQRIFPYGMQSRPPIVHPLLHPLHLQQQQQQHLHQQYLQQRHQHLIQNNCRQSNRYYDDENNTDDEYAGLMTQSEKEWLIKIQQFQTEMKDPYVDDYYYVTYISRKIAAKAATDKENKTTPSLLLPVRPKPAPEPETPKYIPIQFEGSLGKIQVSNVKCPRKLLDCTLNKNNVSPIDTTGDTKTITKSEVQRFRKLLLEIEKLYVVLINIDDEDKRIGALPEEARLPHLEKRRQLCERLFEGLTNETKEKINLEVVKIKKGLALLFRSLSYLSDESQRAVIISDLPNVDPKPRRR